MYGTYTQDLARQRQQTRRQEADVYRLTRETRAAHAAARRDSFRKVVSTAVGLVLWPIKH